MIDRLDRSSNASHQLKVRSAGRR